MPGVHSNIGGPYPGSRLSDISLSWIVARAAKIPTSFSIRTASQTQIALNPTS
ncbi:hypothetical protein [Microbulbifer sp. A4B17]|uniref:hypothetical protein n=1 Tax=Microbulbifer sp. A4B17 TaxID=359370 RepID=UPI00351816DF